MMLSELIGELEWKLATIGDVPVWLLTSHGYFELTENDIHYKEKCECGVCKSAHKKHNVDRIQIETDIAWRFSDEDH